MYNIGILGSSEIAFRRFMPAAMEVDGICVKAIAEEYDKTKLEPFCSEYHLEVADDFEELIKRKDINAVYVPQPPALHYKWAKRALEEGKHVLVEKPSSISSEQSQDLVNLAREKGLALHENYMFQFHSQIKDIQNIINDGKIGEIRLIRADFGFPLRAQNDFRYNAQLGGGALLDAGGYTVKLATKLLGPYIELKTAQLNYLPEYEVDMYGSATLANRDGVICQVGFGMDCHYQCRLEVWGSVGKLVTNRIFTAPPGYEPEVFIETAQGTEVIKLEADSHFTHSIEEFVGEIGDKEKRNAMYDEIVLQARLVEDILKFAK